MVNSFEKSSSVKSKKTFLTLQSCMIKIMKAKCFNKYKILHFNKQNIEKEGDNCLLYL